MLFLYDDIQWTTADRSGGENGLGGTPATVGLNSGDGVHYLIVQGSGSSEIVNVEHATNVGMDGLFIFRTDTDTVAPAPCEWVLYRAAVWFLPHHKLVYVNC